MASLVKKIHQYSFLALLVSLSLSRETNAYYNGHHHQHQQRHLSSHRHQMSHRSSQPHYLSPSSSLGSRSLSPQPPSPKYPNLDRLLHRLDAEAGKSGALVATTSAPVATPRRDLLPSFLRPTAPPPLPATPMSFATTATPHRHRHHQEEVYDDDMDEDEDDDEEEDGRAGYHHSDRDSKLPWNVKFSEDANYQKQQAAGGGGGSLALGSGSSGTSLSERKWQTIGTRQNLDEYRRRKMGNYRPTLSAETEIREVVQHAMRVSREGSCKIPRPKVVQVKDIYPHPSKSYFPHCTILHQCGDDTGCCRHETLACVPRSTHRVELHFYTTTFGGYQGNVVEKLVFYNHTECECQDKMEEVMPRDPGKSTDVGVRHFRHPGNAGRMDSYGPAPLRSYRLDRTPDPPPTKSCKCPSLFSVRHPTEPSESCTCDCFDKQQECIRAKRGKEYFSLQDRLCIQSDECITPECEFGIYLRRAGRCPRKREKFAAFQRYSLDEYK